MSLVISPTLSLPPDSPLWTYAVLAIKGAGKTYDSCVLAEEMVRAGIPIIAIDGMGIWWGLRVGVNGNEGLPVVIFGGAHQDLPIPSQTTRGHSIVDEDKLRLMVKAILEAHMSAILDTSDFRKSQQRRIVAVFVDELFHLNRPYGTRHVFIEEADMWCPQKLSGDVAQAAGAIDDLVRRGGNFNLGCTLITQRSAVLNKDALTQCNCLIALRILHKLDKDAVKTWVESMAKPDDPRIKKWYDGLKDLKNGQAWIWHPETKLFQKIQFRERTTLHATREYYRQAEFQQKDISLIDVQKFVEKFKTAFEPKKKLSFIKPDGKPDLEGHSIKPSEYPGIEGISVTRASVPLRPPSPGPDPLVIEKSKPTVQVEQSQPDIRVATDHPQTPLGKLAVILKNDSDHSRDWTIQRATKQFLKHEWPPVGIEEAFAQLVRWEILRIQPNKAYSSYPSRIKIVEREMTVEVS